MSHSVSRLGWVDIGKREGVEFEADLFFVERTGMPELWTEIVESGGVKERPLPTLLGLGELLSLEEELG